VEKISEQTSPFMAESEILQIFMIKSLKLRFSYLSCFFRRVGVGNEQSRFDLT